VFGSRGSAVPLFYEQIKKGGPVTLTDVSMTRFMMQIPQAVELLLKAALLSRGEDLFILKMPVIRMEDLVKAMIEVLAPSFGYKPSDIKIDIIGKREGEKKYELLMSEEEAEDVYEDDDMFCICKTPLAGFRRSPFTHYCSSETDPMKYKDVVNFLKNVLKEEKYVQR
jgi:FlaA1/EpsC-like NDP-sugar epimerase